MRCSLEKEHPADHLALAMHSRGVTSRFRNFLGYSYYIKLEVTVLGAFGRKVFYFMGLERCSDTKIPFNADYCNAAPRGQLPLTPNFRNGSRSRP